MPDYIVEVEIQLLQRHRFSVSADDEAEAKHQAEDFACDEYELNRFDNPSVRALKCEVERFNFEATPLGQNGERDIMAKSQIYERGYPS